MAPKKPHLHQLDAKSIDLAHNWISIHILEYIHQA